LHFWLLRWVFNPPPSPQQSADSPHPGNKRPWLSSARPISLLLIRRDNPEPVHLPIDRRAGDAKLLRNVGDTPFVPT